MRASNGSGDAAVDLRQDVDAIKGDIAALKTDLVAAMRDLVEAGKSEAGEAKERLEEAVHERLKRVGEAAHNVADRGRKAADNVHRFVEDKPLQSLAMAFGAGLLLGVVLREVKSISRLIVKLADLAEAEARAFRAGAVHVGVAMAVSIAAALVGVAGVIFLVWALFVALQPGLGDAGAAAIVGVLLLGGAGGLLWLVINKLAR